VSGNSNVSALPWFDSGYGCGSLNVSHEALFSDTASGVGEGSVGDPPEHAAVPVISSAAIAIVVQGRVTRAV
jgi:hypothetical protein